MKVILFRVSNIICVTLVNGVLSPEWQVARGRRGFFFSRSLSFAHSYCAAHAEGALLLCKVLVGKGQVPKLYHNSLPLNYCAVS